MKKFLRVIAYGRPYVFRMGLGLLCVISVAMLGLLVPQIIRFVIDQVLGGKPLRIHPITIRPFGHAFTYNSEQWLGLILVALIGLYVVRGLLGFARTYLLSWVGQRVLFDLRNQIFTRLQELPLRFYETRGTGQIMARITGDVDAVGGMMTSSTVDLLTYLVMVVAIATILLRTHWQMALMSFIFLPLFAANYQSFIRRIMGYYRHLRRQWSELYGDLHESIAGAQVVKAFSQEKYETRQIFRGFRETYGTHIILARLHTLMGALGELIAASGTAFILWYGGRAALHGELTTGQVIAFYTYLGQLYGPIVTLMNMNDVIQRSLISADRVFDILDAKSTIQDAPNAYPLPPVVGRVRFEHVSFGYDPEKLVLEDIDFEAQPGQMIALVGPSGSGKTTVANLLPRFYDPKEGRILIDGHDISRVTLRSLRSQIGIVLQENVLFSGSVKDNLRYGKMDATDQEIVEAAIAANAHDFIVSELPEGYDTEVRERGVRLSGGQKQRIAIARAILRDPRILILDEATSSLDSEAEAQIQEAMERLLQGRTTFVIAHRLSTVMKAHRIIVLESGRIIESGTHEELVAAGGKYAQMYRKQFKVEEKEEAWLK